METSTNNSQTSSTNNTEKIEIEEINLDRLMEKNIKINRNDVPIDEILPQHAFEWLNYHKKNFKLIANHKCIFFAFSNKVAGRWNYTEFVKLVNLIWYDELVQYLITTNIFNKDEFKPNGKTFYKKIAFNSFPAPEIKFRTSISSIETGTTQQKTKQENDSNNFKRTITLNKNNSDEESSEDTSSEDDDLPVVEEVMTSINNSESYVVLNGTLNDIKPYNDPKFSHFEPLVNTLHRPQFGVPVSMSIQDEIDDHWDINCVSGTIIIFRDILLYYIVKILVMFYNFFHPIILNLIARVTTYFKNFLIYLNNTNNNPIVFFTPIIAPPNTTYEPIRKYFDTHKELTFTIIFNQYIFLYILIMIICPIITSLIIILNTFFNSLLQISDIIVVSILLTISLWAAIYLIIVWIFAYQYTCDVYTGRRAATYKFLNYFLTEYRGCIQIEHYGEAKMIAQPLTNDDNKYKHNKYHIIRIKDMRRPQFYFHSQNMFTTIPTGSLNPRELFVVNDELYKSTMTLRTNYFQGDTKEISAVINKLAANSKPVKYNSEHYYEIDNPQAVAIELAYLTTSARFQDYKRRYGPDFETSPIHA